MQIISQSDVKQLGTILGIWAHPDDETWTSAGLMAMAADNNQRVACVTATYGENGVQDPMRWPADHLADIRKHELQAACDVIGIQQHYYLGLRDGSCQQAENQPIIKQLCNIIDREKPDTILTFGPSGSTGHPDHIAISQWASLAVQTTRVTPKPVIYHSVHSKEWYERSGKRLGNQFNIFFNIDQPPLVHETKADIALALDDTYCARKLKALQVQPSQTAIMLESAGKADLKDLACFECFMIAN